MAYEKFVRKFQILQKKLVKNSNIKTSKKPKNIKELNDSLLRNYWNKTKYIWLNNRKIQKKNKLHSKE